MKNDLFTIGSITIHGYGLMIGIGIIAAYYLAEYRANKRGMDVDMILSIAICGVVCGILGAKLLYYVTIFDEILANPKKLLDISDDLSCMAASSSAACWAAEEPGSSIFPFSSMQRSGHAVGCAFRAGLWTDRLFLAGCCYGMPTHSHLRSSTIRTLPRITFRWFRPSSSQAGLDFALSSASLCGEKVQKQGQVVSLYLICSRDACAGIFPR